MDQRSRVSLSVKASQDSRCQLPGKMPEILANERQALPVYSSVTIPQSL